MNSSRGLNWKMLPWTLCVSCVWETSCSRRVYFTRQLETSVIAILRTLPFWKCKTNWKIVKIRQRETEKQTTIRWLWLENFGCFTISCDISLALIRWLNYTLWLDWMFGWKSVTIVGTISEALGTFSGRLDAIWHTRWKVRYVCRDKMN